MQINWYPGHMARAKRALADQLSRVDVVVELCDARIPRASRNPDLADMIKNKRHLLVLGKADLADERETRAWLGYFRAQGIDCMSFDSIRGKAKDIIARIEKASADAVAKMAAKGVKKTVRVMIVGVPNVGKSTLTNALVGEKIAIVSNKPQTTRNRITAIVNRGDTQFVLMDTPGFHKPRTRLGDYMVQVVRESVADVDAVLLMVEPVAAIGPQEEALIERLRESGAPAILLINKIDTVDKTRLLEVIALYSAAYDFDAVIPISAKNGEGLDELFTELEKYAVEGPHLFPDDMITDQPERQICAELVREKLLTCLDKEIPHGTAVEVTKFSERDDGIIDLEVTIYCEKDSHKGIIIGKKGAMLKKIGELARMDIEEFMGTKVYLQTWVKVKENWRDSMAQLRNFGYGER